MEHNYFEVYNDLVVNMTNFFKAFIKEVDEDDEVNEFSLKNNEIKFPLFMYTEPKNDF
jgi:hypothetical protein